MEKCTGKLQPSSTTLTIADSLGRRLSHPEAGADGAGQAAAAVVRSISMGNRDSWSGVLCFSRATVEDELEIQVGNSTSWLKVQRHGTETSGID